MAPCGSTGTHGRMFRVYHSNRLETLLGQLAALSGAPAGGPLLPETVVIQSRGMARWLALNLAEHRTVAANIEFVLPATFFWRVLTSQLPDAGDGSAFDREVLAWRLMAVLPELLEQPGFEPLQQYLRGERPELRRWQLCRRIADVFDQYLVYRPEMILGWERGPAEDDDWQAHLWRRLVADAGVHRARLMHEFLSERLVLDPARLPPRVCIFGIPALPPVYLESLAKLAEVVDVHLFALNPCLQFWGDIEDPRTIARLRQRRARLGQREEQDHHTCGNSLLASLGRAGRDFIDALHGLAGDEEEFFTPAPAPGVLGVIQGDMLALQERGRDLPALTLAPEDTSLRIHVCHSPLREVEVLHDQLLARFEADPALRPQDVIVMTPDIERYAPYIEAVFGAAPEARRIPWAIADLARQSEHTLVQAFLDLLELPSSRFTATQVLSLLEHPAVLRRVRLSFQEFETVRGWVRESGIRWGLDAGSRAELALPELETNTWAFGFRRLLLGYAMAPGAPHGERLFRGVLPYPEVEGQEAVLLGRLRDFVERLAALRQRLEGRHSAAAWAALLSHVLDDFFAPEDDAAEPLLAIREALAELVDQSGQAGYSDAFGLDVLREHLRDSLSRSSTEQRFLTGRLTFCAMLPMRSLPFRVVALIGMNDGAFPRQQRPLGFDRMAARPRRGDRSRREEDRYLFLEAMISAREQLYISHVGRSVRDNSALLPSVLVNELLDYIDQAFVSDAGPARQVLITEHPLQPFSPRYFRATDGLFSYAEEWLPAAQARAAGGPAPFCAEALPALDAPGNGATDLAINPASQPAIELDALCRFFRHPVRAFLRDRLGIHPGAEHKALDDEEPFSLNGLDKYGLCSELLEHLLAGGETDDFGEVFKARGSLPAGGFADLLLAREAGAVEALATAVAERLRAPLPALEVRLAGADWRLTGWLDRLTRDGLIHYRVGKPKAADYLTLWVQHLVLNVLAPEDCPPISRLLAGEGAEQVLAPVEDAQERLARLVEIYRDGQRQPLFFMPKSSLEFAQAEHAGKDPFAAAARAWKSGWRDGEDAQPEYRLAFRGIADPLGAASFAELAREVCGPLVAALEEGAQIAAEEGA